MSLGRASVAVVPDTCMVEGMNVTDGSLDTPPEGGGGGGGDCLLLRHVGRGGGASTSGEGGLVDGGVVSWWEVGLDMLWGGLKRLRHTLAGLMKLGGIAQGNYRLAMQVSPWQWRCRLKSGIADVNTRGACYY